MTPVQKPRSMSEITSKDSKPHRPPKVTSVNVFDEVLKRLEMIKCTEISTRMISYGMIFKGLYHGVGFEFNVYVNGKGHLNPKTKHNPVWHKPVRPLVALRHTIDKVIEW